MFRHSVSYKLQEHPNSESVFGVAYFFDLLLCTLHKVRLCTRYPFGSRRTDVYSRPVTPKQTFFFYHILLLNCNQHPLPRSRFPGPAQDNNNNAQDHNNLNNPSDKQHPNGGGPHSHGGTPAGGLGLGPAARRFPPPMMNINAHDEHQHQQPPRAAPDRASDPPGSPASPNGRSPPGLAGGLRPLSARDFVSGSTVSPSGNFLIYPIKTVGLLGAPLVDGQNLEGADLAPLAMREAGFEGLVRQLG